MFGGGGHGGQEVHSEAHGTRKTATDHDPLDGSIHGATNNPGPSFQPWGTWMVLM